MPILRILNDDQCTTIEVPHGTNLREILLNQQQSPYTRLTQVANCGGRGLCATCGVWIETGEPTPQHWHDALASRFGYPRLACQITITDDLTIRLVKDKWIWGGREVRRARRWHTS
jgi:ferredoxin